MYRAFWGGSDSGSCVWGGGMKVACTMNIEVVIVVAVV